MYEPGELAEIVRALERNEWGTWSKIAALDGARLRVVCCCNSEQCQRVKVEQESGRSAVMMGKMSGKDTSQMPHEVEEILDACRTNGDLRKQIRAFARAKFDVAFVCEGRTLVDWQIKDA